MAPRTQLIATAPQLGAILQGVRKSRQLTQAQLGERLGLSQKRISDLERVPATLSVDQLLAICNQLGLQLCLQAREDAQDAAASSASQW